MYKHKHLAPSNTSLSDDNDNDGDNDDDNVVIKLVAHPAHWASQGVVSTLPPEILIHILKHLSSPKDLYHSLRVSRTWCECAVELLWHKPSFSKFSTLKSMIHVLSQAESKQRFAYATLIRRLNFLTLASSLKDDYFKILANCVRLERLTLVNCSELSSVALAEVLPSCPNLVAVDLTSVVNTTDEAIKGLALSARRLQGINLANCKDVTDTAITALAANCPLLRRVKLSGVELITDQSISALAKSCPLLLEIDLNKCKLVTDVSIRDIWTYSTHMREVRLSHCTELTDAAFPATLRTDINNCNVPTHPFPLSKLSDDVELLPPLIITRTFEHLRMLDLSACANITDDAIEGIVSHAPKIRNLVLSKCALLTDRAVETICRLGRHLHYLHMGHAIDITDRSVRTLARSCTRLRYIDFANCVRLTDMSVFELSALPKLRRVGLVRVNNLTDEAVYSLAERHATLERIHLSYCDRISVGAIHFLLQKLHKLTHLSLTGVPAFRQPTLQRFCRPPPKDFNISQQAAFCVYSGKGVSQLRAFLTEYFDHMNENNGTDDTEYEDDYDGDGEVDGDADLEHSQDDDNLEPQDEEEGDEEVESTLRGSHTTFPPARVDLRAAAIQAAHLPHRRVPDTTHLNAAIPQNPQAIYLDPPQYYMHLRAIGAIDGPAPSSNRRIWTDLPVVEPPHSPAPSDVASNRSTHTNTSNGATFFRTYHLNQGIGQSHINSSATLVGLGGESILAVSRGNGALTPELNYAEIGHGRGAQVSVHTAHGSRTVSGGSAVPQRGDVGGGTGEWRVLEVDSSGGEPSRTGPYESRHLQHEQPSRPEARLEQPRQRQQPSNRHVSRGQALRSEEGIWPYREPASPVSLAAARELQASVQSALGGVASSPHHAVAQAEQSRHHRESQRRQPPSQQQDNSSYDDSTDTPAQSSGLGHGQAQSSSTEGDNRGRSVKRSIRNTFTAAEQYASSLLFGRNSQEGRDGSRSGTPSGSGPPTK
ncbi:hypothetical protein CCMSSC00406_0000993 [Pleurotus cornucopiae]|uniref:Uncharacterized protein n=1 Tax=Pleurotus cornucopiae TaxID=5321 RepID=A0ACB7IMX8_PLECO|nr:hypothetical protein CCMSSC00406_0000993 [Pleurotus cornucopiae]